MKIRITVYVEHVPVNGHGVWVRGNVSATFEWGDGKWKRVKIDMTLGTIRPRFRQKEIAAEVRQHERLGRQSSAYARGLLTVGGLDGRVDPSSLFLQIERGFECKFVLASWFGIINAICIACIV